MKIQAFNETKVSNPGIMGSGYDEYSLKTDLEISDVNVAFVKFINYWCSCGSIIIIECFRIF